MIPIETQIFRLIFPPSGSIPLEKIEAVPHIRQHINSIIDLASTEHGISSPDESAALTTRVIELRDTPGPDGKIRTWRTIAEICGTTLDSVRHRYGKGKATIRKSRTVEEVAVPDGEFTEIERQTPQQGMYRLNASEEFVRDHSVCEHQIPLEAELEKPTEQEKKPDEVATIRESQAVEKPKPLNPETLAEVDRMLGEGVSVLDIAAELEKKGRRTRARKGRRPRTSGTAGRRATRGRSNRRSPGTSLDIPIGA